MSKKTLREHARLQQNHESRNLSEFSSAFSHIIPFAESNPDKYAHIGCGVVSDRDDRIMENVMLAGQKDPLYYNLENNQNRRIPTVEIDLDQLFLSPQEEIIHLFEPNLENSTQSKPHFLDDHVLPPISFLKNQKRNTRI